MDPDGFDWVNNGWESLEGTRTQQFDPILSLLGPHTRPYLSYSVIFVPKIAFLRTYHDPVDPDGFDLVKNCWESLKGSTTEQFDPILPLLGPQTRPYHDPVDQDGFDWVKNGWESLEGTKTEQLGPILSLLGPHIR